MVKLPQQELGASFCYKRKTSLSLSGGPTSPDRSLEFYAA